MSFKNLKKDNEMEEYIVVEFDSRRLQRGEKHCFRANVFIGGEPDGWVWLSMAEIKEIMKDCACKISGHEEFVKNGEKMNINIDDLTLGQIKEIAKLQNCDSTKNNSSIGLNKMIGQKVIIRTYSAGVWFGLLEQKDGKEVILSNARRMYQWWCKEGISLSAVALYGLNQAKSKIIEAVPSVWLEAIEIIPCSDIAIKDLEEAQNVKAQ